MTDRTDDEDESPRKKKKGEGDSEGDSDSWGRGKAGAASGVKIARPSAEHLKIILADWKHLNDAAQAERAVAEFFGDSPMRASANLVVSWIQTEINAKSFALVNWIIIFGKKAADDLKLTRARIAGRDSRGFKIKRGPTQKLPGMITAPSPTGGGI